jgi:hypothetical protein
MEEKEKEKNTANGIARKGCGARVEEKTREKNKKDTSTLIAKKRKINQARQTHRLRPVYMYPIPTIRSQSSPSVLAQSYTILS